MNNLAKVNFIHLCDHALADMNQKASIIGIFQNINVKSFPVVQPKFTVVLSANFLKKDDKEHELKIKLVNPVGTELGVTSYKMNLDKTGDGLFIQDFINQEFLVPGEYKIDILMDEEAIGGTTFNIIQIN